MKTKLLLYTVIIYLISISSSFAGPWLLKKNELTLNNKVTIYEDSRSYNNNLEFGINDDLTVALKNHTNKNVDFYYRKLMCKGDKFVVSIQPLVNVPMQADNDNYYTELRLLAGYNFTKKHFSAIELAYNQNITNGSAKYISDVTYGLNLGKNKLAFQLFNIIGTSKIKKSVLPSYININDASDSDYIVQIKDKRYFNSKLQISYLFPLSDTTKIQIGGFKTIINKRSYNEKAVILSLWLSL